MLERPFQQPRPEQAGRQRAAVPAQHPGGGAGLQLLHPLQHGQHHPAWGVLPTGRNAGTSGVLQALQDRGHAAIQQVGYKVVVRAVFKQGCN